jgi:hypothetical protein
MNDGFDPPGETMQSLGKKRALYNTIKERKKE